MNGAGTTEVRHGFDPAFAQDCPVAHEVANSVVYLPTYPKYTESEVRKNIAVIREFVESKVGA